MGIVVPHPRRANIRSRVRAVARVFFSHCFSPLRLIPEKRSPTAHQWAIGLCSALIAAMFSVAAKNFKAAVDDDRESREKFIAFLVNIGARRRDVSLRGIDCEP